MAPATTDLYMEFMAIVFSPAAAMDFSDEIDVLLTEQRNHSIRFLPFHFISFYLLSASPELALAFYRRAQIGLTCGSWRGGTYVVGTH